MMELELYSWRMILQEELDLSFVQKLISAMLSFLDNET